MSAVTGKVMDADGERTMSSSTQTGEASSRRRNLFFLVDVLCMICVAAPLGLFKYVGKPYHRGFFCEDTTISKPYKPSTVPSAAAVIVGMLIDILPVIINEICRHRQQKDSPEEYTQFPVVIGPFKIPRVALRILNILWVLLFGGLVCGLITDVGKYTLGRLRPHFLTVCKPNMTLFNCSDGFIMQDVCTGDPGLIREARLSFPSGHSSNAAYTMMFAILYFHTEIQISGPKFLKFVIQLIWALMGLLCGMSRVSDYKHHWSDVLAGFILGILVAFFTYWQLLDIKSENRDRNKGYRGKEVNPLYTSGV